MRHDDIRFLVREGNALRTSDARGSLAAAWVADVLHGSRLGWGEWIEQLDGRPEGLLVAPSAQKVLADAPSDLLVEPGGIPGELPLGFAEVEALRALNLLARDREMPPAQHRALLRAAAARLGLRGAGRSEPWPAVPDEHRPAARRILARSRAALAAHASRSEAAFRGTVDEGEHVDERPSLAMESAATLLLGVVDRHLRQTPGARALAAPIVGSAPKRRRPRDPEPPETIGPARATAAPLPVPDGAAVLHIGLHKTGTTAIQNAAAEARAALLDHGVSYPGRDVNHADAVAGLLGFQRRSRAVSERRWEEIASEVALADPRLAWISDERLSSASPEQVATLRARIGRPVHVVITVRALGEWVPSVWQQYVKAGAAHRLVEWLPRVLSDPPGQLRARPFPFEWPAEVVERWHDAADAGITVVVLDADEPDLLYRSFEALLDVAPSTLQPSHGGGFRANRGLSGHEAALVRRMNEEFSPREAPPGGYLDLIRLGVIAGMQEYRRPAGDETPIRVPDDFAPALQAVIDRETRRLAAHDVGVLGDLASVNPPVRAVPLAPEPERLPFDLVEAALTGLVAQVTGAGVLFRHVDGRGAVVTAGWRSAATRSRVIRAVAGRAYGVVAGIRGRWRR